MAVRNWWLDSGTTSTGGFIKAEDLEPGTLTAGTIGTGAVTTAKLADATVTSEKVSTNVLTRTVLLPFGKLTASSSGGWSSTYVVYRPLVTMTINSVAVINLNNWENATADEFLVFRNSSSCVAGVSFSAGSTARAAGTRTAAATVNNGRVTAGTDLTFKSVVSTCSVSTLGVIELHYVTTD